MNGHNLLSSKTILNLLITQHEVHHQLWPCCLALQLGLGRKEILSSVALLLYSASFITRSPNKYLGLVGSKTNLELAILTSDLQTHFVNETLLFAYSC